MSRRRAPAVAMPTGQLVLTIGGVSGTITIADIRTPGDKPRAVRIAMRFPPEVQILRAELLKGGGGDE
jgi:hypothetical protein